MRSSESNSRGRGALLAKGSTSTNRRRRPTPAGRLSPPVVVVPRRGSMTDEVDKNKINNDNRRNYMVDNEQRLELNDSPPPSSSDSELNHSSRNDPKRRRVLSSNDTSQNINHVRFDSRERDDELDKKQEPRGLKMFPKELKEAKDEIERESLEERELSKQLAELEKELHELQSRKTPEEYAEIRKNRTPEEEACIVLSKETFGIEMQTNPDWRNVLQKSADFFEEWESPFEMWKPSTKNWFYYDAPGFSDEIREDFSYNLQRDEPRLWDQKHIPSFCEGNKWLHIPFPPVGQGYWKKTERHSPEWPYEVGRHRTGILKTSFERKNWTEAVERWDESDWNLPKKNIIRFANRVEVTIVEYLGHKINNRWSSFHIRLIDPEPDYLGDVPITLTPRTFEAWNRMAMCEKWIV